MTIQNKKAERVRNMENYIGLELEIIKFNSEDIITDSTGCWGAPGTDEGCQGLNE